MQNNLLIFLYYKYLYVSDDESPGSLTLLVMIKYTERLLFLVTILYNDISVIIFTFILLVTKVLSIKVSLYSGVIIKRSHCNTI